MRTFLDINSMDENLKFLDPETTLSNIELLNQQFKTLIDEKNSLKTRVLLLGSTGTGKTTFMHLMAGCEMDALKIEKNPSLILNCGGNCPVSGMNISHISKSETISPGLMKQSNILLCDCPGMLNIKINVTDVD